MSKVFLLHAEANGSLHHVLVPSLRSGRILFVDENLPRWVVLGLSSMSNTDDDVNAAVTDVELFVLVELQQGKSVPCCVREFFHLSIFSNEN